MQNPGGTMNLASYVSGEWKTGSGAGEALVDPVTGEELARISSQGVDVKVALDFARVEGGAELRALSYGERAALLGKAAEVLASNREEYFRISLLNLGANQADASFDVDGAIYTMKYYAKIGAALADGKILKEGAQVSISKTGVFFGQHYLVPAKGVAVVIKPASPTAWLTHRMVEDVLKANILPRGAISMLCGSARDLLDYVGESDVVSFTGSADTAVKIRSHANVLRRSVRVNVEADSINSVILGRDVSPGTDLFELLVKEVVKEMTLKAGQKCTAIRRVFVPRQQMKAVGDAIAARLGSMKTGNPRNTEVKIGPVVNKAQQAACLEGLRQLKQECAVVFGGDEKFQPVDADAAKSAFVQPTLLACENGSEAKFVHDVEVFGPAATLIAYDDTEHVIALARRGLGSLVASIFANDATFIQSVVLGIGDLHGRIMVVDSSVGNQYTGHGNVVPSCLHGGPGRAGGGEELAGLRALFLYHRRFVVQGPPSLTNALGGQSADASVLYS